MDRSPHLELAKGYWKKHLSPGDLAIDATCGNGHDTLFLVNLGCFLVSLDVQEAALEKTRCLLSENLNEEDLKRVILCRMSHEDLRKAPCPKPPRLIVYNLGYLPKGDKTVTTMTESTLASAASALSILEKKGAISMTCYPGHSEGKKEEDAMLQFASSLASNEWEVRHHRWINRPLSPSVLWIARLENT